MPADLVWAVADSAGPRDSEVVRRLQEAVKISYLAPTLVWIVHRLGAKQSQVVLQMDLKTWGRGDKVSGVGTREKWAKESGASMLEE